jgi:hypothetical protein
VIITAISIEWKVNGGEVYRSFPQELKVNWGTKAANQMANEAPVNGAPATEYGYVKYFQTTPEYIQGPKDIESAYKND